MSRVVLDLDAERAAVHIGGQDYAFADLSSEDMGRWAVFSNQFRAIDVRIRELRDKLASNPEGPEAEEAEKQLAELEGKAKELSTKIIRLILPDMPEAIAEKIGIVNRALILQAFTKYMTELTSIVQEQSPRGE